MGSSNTKEAVGGFTQLYENREKASYFRVRAQEFIYSAMNALE